ncbi:major coat protein [Achromobacter xylosoxidans]|uniref:major coat protein n=2 Tax=Betaproteobacteria TaxID=28216 RepID=UPI003BA85F87
MPPEARRIIMGKAIQPRVAEYIGYAWAMVVVIVGATIGIKLFKKFTSKAS